MTTLEINLCTCTHVYTHTNALEIHCWKHIWSRWKCRMESIQAVEFNTAINITSLSYSSTTQPPLINTAVSSALATNHMTGTVTPSPCPEGAQHACTGTALDTSVQGHKEETDWNPTPWCHPGICFIAAPWSIAGVAFAGIIQECRGNQKAPSEVSL